MNQALTNQNSQWCTFTYSCFLSFFREHTSILKYLYVLNKKYLTCIFREHKPFRQLSRSNDFTTDAVANLSVHERRKIPEAYSEPSRISKMELFVINDERLKVINNICKKLLRCSTGSKYVSASFFPGTFYMLLGKELWRRKKIEELRNKVLQMFVETSPNYCFYQKKAFI